MGARRQMNCKNQNKKKLYKNCIEFKFKNKNGKGGMGARGLISFKIQNKKKILKI